MNLLAPSAQRMPFTTEATEEHRGLRRTEYLLPQRAQRSTETWIGLRCRAGRLAALVRTTARGNAPLISRIAISGECLSLKTVPDPASSSPSRAPTCPGKPRGTRHAERHRN